MTNEQIEVMTYIESPAMKINIAKGTALGMGIFEAIEYAHGECQKSLAKMVKMAKEHNPAMMEIIRNMAGEIYLKARTQL